MATTKFYLDKRGTKGEAPIKIMISHRNNTSFIITDIRIHPEFWSDGRVVMFPGAAQINNALVLMKASVDNHIETLRLSGKLRNMTASEIRTDYLGTSTPVRGRKGNFVVRFEEFMSSRATATTRSMYQMTLDRIRSYDASVNNKCFEEIDKTWIRGFERFLSDAGNSINTIGIHLRNLRAVFNDAIDDDLTTAYPFRKIKIRHEATRDRSLTAEDLRTIFRYPCEEWQREYVDMFKLIFLLRGINIGDLSELERISAGRVEYNRKKTHKHYSIRLEPEAMELIEKYRGEKYLLSILDRYKNYKDYLHHMNDALKKLGMDCRIGARPKGTPLFPEISSYYARYSWASIAAELDIPKETIAAGLGHSQSDVTAIYIRNDMRKKVDEANRKIIDYVLYGG